MSDVVLHPAVPGYPAHVFGAEAIRAILGANQGDPIGPAEYCEPGDVYQLRGGTEAQLLMLRQTGETGGSQTIVAGSEIGRPGETVTLLSQLTLMAPDGERVEMLILTHEASGRDFALPLSPILARTDYALIATQDPPENVRLADIVCVSFTPGTLITLAGGRQIPIETLRPGDKVLTRDAGPQPVRWIGRARLRAVGGFAPVVITKGTLGNTGDLIVSQHHRIFLYQRGTERVGRTAELLVQAKHLVDGDRVYLREGGHADYLSLIFDRHEIVFAEGIAAESLMVNEATLRLLPDDLAEEVRTRFPGLYHTQHFGTEATRRALDEIGRQSLFRPET